MYRRFPPDREEAAGPAGSHMNDGVPSAGPEGHSSVSLPSQPLGAALVWSALVAVAVLGRLWQPTWQGEPLWNVTPMAAVALAAGTVFGSPLVAASVPLAALAISNLVLPAYGSVAMAAVVYAAMAWPVVLGPLVRRASGRGSLARAATLAGGSLASSLVFFLTTNLACWVLDDGLYPRTAAGLAACYTAALPFYRWMPVGDLVWTAILFGGMALATRAGLSLTAVETA